VRVWGGFLCLIWICEWDGVRNEVLKANGAWVATTVMYIYKNKQREWSVSLRLREI
jgi:hypothetical protein